jgi:hypothetical protein
MVLATQLPLSSGVFWVRIFVLFLISYMKIFSCKALAGRSELFCLFGALPCFVPKARWQRASQRLVVCGGKIHFEYYMFLLLLSHSPVGGHQYFVFYGGRVAILRHDSYDEMKMGMCDTGATQFQFLISRAVKTI